MTSNKMPQTFLFGLSFSIRYNVLCRSRGCSCFDAYSTAGSDCTLRSIQEDGQRKNVIAEMAELCSGFRSNLIYVYYFLQAEPRKISIYREEAINTLVSCLKCSDSPATQIAASDTILALQGRFSSSGNPL
ncbi:hypothetical protein Tco_1259019, partial [Tanacetum coccineum]